MSSENSSALTEDCLRRLTFRPTFVVERNLCDRVSVVGESFFARVRVLFNYLSSLVGYGKFEYTREGVNQETGVCRSRNAGYGAH